MEDKKEMKARWNFVINEPRIGIFEGKIQPLYYNGHSCSHCRFGGGESIPQSYGEMTEEEAAKQKKKERETSSSLPT